MVKICQHQYKGRGCTQEKSQDTASSREDAIIIFTGLNLSGRTVHNIYEKLKACLLTSFEIFLMNRFWHPGKYKYFGGTDKEQLPFVIKA
jgi:hypothetical protein